MQFELKVKMDNAAFEDPRELPRILRDLAEKLEPALESEPTWVRIPVRDVNGNTVGLGVVKR